MKITSWKSSYLKDVLLQEWDTSTYKSAKFSQRSYHIIQVKTGCIELNLNGSKKILRREEAIFIHRYQKWNILNFRNATASSISIRRKYLETYTNGIHNAKLDILESGSVFTPPSFNLSYIMFSSALKLQEKKHVLTGLMEELLVFLYVGYDPKSLSADLINKSKALIKMKKMEGTRVNVLADNLLLTTYELVTGFIDQYGVTPHIYEYSLMSEHEKEASWHKVLKKDEHFNCLITSLLKK